MKTLIEIGKLLLLTIFMSCNWTIQKKLKYIDKNKPLLQPKIFAENFISTDSLAVFGSVFNKKGNEFFFGVDSNSKAEIRFTKMVNGKWVKPIPIISHEKYSFNDPFLSPNENKLFYISDKPRNKQDTIKDFDIWFSERNGQKWSEPINAGMLINSDADEYYISFSKKGTMYFASNKNAAANRKHDFDLYNSKNIDGQFTAPKKLSKAINSGRYEADVFISLDESYIIYSSAKKSGFGKGDLYINFKDKNGKWTNAVNMGKQINSEKHELCPFVTNDGKYFFYTSNQKIYWVSTAIFTELKSN